MKPHLLSGPGTLRLAVLVGWVMLPDRPALAADADLLAWPRFPLGRLRRDERFPRLPGRQQTRSDEAEQEIPVWRMISAKVVDLRLRAQFWVRELGQGEVLPSLSTVGGGSLPVESLPTAVMALQVASPNRFLAKLRDNVPPIIARLEDNRVIFAPRTVLPDQDEILLNGIRAAIG